MGGRDPGERYRTLLEINNAIISNLTPEALFRAIAGALRPVLPFDRTALFLHDPARDTLRLVFLESEMPSAYFSVGLELPVEGSHVGRVFREAQPLLRRDLGREREYPAEEQAWADGVRSFAVVPLRARGRTLGTLAVASAATDQYAGPEVTFLQEIANQIALAVENMTTYREITELNLRLTALAARYRTLLEINNAVVANLTREKLFQTIAEALRRVVPFDRTAIFLHEPARGSLRLFALEGHLPSAHFVVGHEEPVEGSHVGRVFQERQPLLRRDLTRDGQYPAEALAAADGVRSTLVVPLVVHERAVGVLGVASTVPGRYSEADADFLQEAVNQIALAIENMRAFEAVAALKGRLEAENVYLQEEIRDDHDFVEMVGRSPALLAVLRRVEQVAPTDSTVLISGETGTGKELVARALHGRSRRRNRPLVKVNCSAISAGLVESELFGHVKGAFTGALERRVGRFELADGGTIFLDEVGDLPRETQVKLLRVLQEQEFEPVGQSRPVRVDVRVIAATNRDLQHAVETGQFREDLYYRLNVVPLVVPPLRERPADIPLLVTFFLARFARRFGKRVESVSAETMASLVAYPWPGNVRELQNVIERAVVLADGPVLTLSRDLLPVPAAGRPAVAPAAPEAPPGAGAEPGPVPTLEDLQRRHIAAVLARTQGVIEGPRGAARILGLHPNTLRSRMERLGIPRSGHDGPANTSG
jgi:formate hydrogenlyase transcriptional activator